MALVTKRVMNACHRSAILVIHFMVGGAAVLMVKQERDRALQCKEVSGRTVRVSKHLKTRLGSSLAWPDPFRAGRYRLVMISARSERVWSIAYTFFVLEIYRFCIC